MIKKPTVMTYLNASWINSTTTEFLSELAGKT